jgi:fumarate hydratase class II
MQNSFPETYWKTSIWKTGKGTEDNMNVGFVENRLLKMGGGWN